MTDHAAFTGSIPGHYDTLLGPHIFEPFAGEMASRIAATSPGIVLELAAGTGIVTRHLRDALPAHAELISTDLNNDMLEVARAKFEPDEVVAFEVADAQKLSFGDAAFDAIACQFGIMFFPDRAQSYREALRVLKPGGAYVLSTWCNLEDNPFAALIVDIADGLFPDDPPEFYRVPFSLGDPDPICAELKAAGFTSIQAERIDLISAVPDAAVLAHGMTYGNPFVEEVRARGINPDDMKATLLEALKSAFGDPGEMPLAINIITATA